MKTRITKAEIARSKRYCKHPVRFNTEADAQIAYRCFVDGYTIPRAIGIWHGQKGYRSAPFEMVYLWRNT